MALTPEDGSGTNPDANSYVGLQEIKDYAAARGATLPGTDQEIETLAIQSMDYLEAQRDRYQGQKTTGTQPLQWPRYPVTVDGFQIGGDEVPLTLKNAQCALVIEANTEDLQPNRLPADTGPVTKEKVATIEVEYAEPDQQPYTPAFAKADALLAPLYKQNGLKLVRV